MNNSQHNAFMKTAQMGFLKAFTGFIITGFGGEKKKLIYVTQQRLSKTDLLEMTYHLKISPFNVFFLPQFEKEIK